METPPLEEWGFPPWLVCVCESDNRFKDTRKILIEMYQFVPSPIEEDYLVLPIKGINLEKRFKSDDYDTLFGGWGIGRVIFHPTEFINATCTRGGPSFEFKYFADSCPWEYIQPNPMKPATIELIELLKPRKFLDYQGREIPNPY